MRNRLGTRDLTKLEESQPDPAVPSPCHELDHVGAPASPASRGWPHGVQYFPVVKQSSHTLTHLGMCFFLRTLRKGKTRPGNMPDQADTSKQISTLYANVTMRMSLPVPTTSPYTALPPGP